MNNKITLIIVTILMFFSGAIAYCQDSGAKNAFDDLDKEESSVNTPDKTQATTNDTIQAKDNSSAITGSVSKTTEPSVVISSVTPKGDQKRIYIVHDFKIDVLSLLTYEQIAELPGEFTVTTLKNLLVSPETAYIAIYDNNNFKLISDFGYEGQPMPRNARAKITLDGKKLYVGALGWGKAVTSGVFVVDLENKKQIKVLNKNAIDSGFIDMSQDGRYLYIPTAGKVSVVKTSDDTEYKNIDLGKDERIEDLIVGSNSIIYVVSCHKSGVIFIDYKFSAVDIEKGILKTIKFTSGISNVFRLLLNQDGKYLYILGNKRMLKLDTSTQTVIKETDFEYLSEPSAISPDGKLLFVQALKENKVVVYDIAKDSVVKEIPFKKDLYDIIVK